MRTPSVVGRDAELAVLEQHLAAANRSQPGVVLVEGEAGIGKSALLQAFVAQHRDVTLQPWTGDETETELAFALVHQLLENAATAGPDLTRTWADPFAAGAAVLAHIGHATASGPLVLVLDDLHLADQSSLVALNFALRRLRHDPVLAVLSLRSGHQRELPSSLERLAKDNGAHVVVRGLSVFGVQQLAAQACGTRLSRRSAERLRSMTGGNPLHLKALFNEVPLADLDAMDRPIPAPRSFAQLTIADLAGATPNARRVAMAASVLGDHCELPILMSVAGLEAGAALSALQELDRMQILHLPPGTSEVVFAHPLVRAAVYSDLGPAVRSELHLTAARALTGPPKLRHRLAAAVHPDSKLATELEAWSRRERLSGNLPSAAEAMLSAYRMTIPGPTADRRLLDAVKMLAISGDAKAARLHESRIAALPPSGPQLAVQARIAWLTGRGEDAVALGQRAWAQPDLDPSERDLVAAMLAQLEVLSDRGTQAVMWADRALADGRLEPTLASHTNAQRALGLAIKGQPAEGLAALAELPKTPEDVPAERHEELSMRGHLALWSGPPRLAEADLRVAAALTHGDMQPFRLTAASALAHACFYAGRWDEAQAIFQQTLALAEDMGQAWIMGFLHADAALVPATRGKWSTAEQHIARSQLYVSETGSQATAAYADEAATLLAVARDDPSGVVRATERLRRMPESSAQRELAMFSWPAHVIVALSRMGRMDEAKAERAVLSRRARHGEPRTEAARLRAAGELAVACEDLDQARENLGAAVAMAEEPVDALEQALALDAYGRFLRRRGEHDAAVEHLEQAHHRFQLLAAKPFVERCEQELAACGVRTQDPATRINPLTPQERVVAAHICAGKTNRQVANELVLSVKTIGFHLSNIYAKLDVHSRTQLVAAMSRMDSTVGRSPTGRSGR